MTPESEHNPLAWMARVGYAARGLVFIIVGGFAMLAAFGSGARPLGTRDALQSLFEHPLGGVLLWLIVGGLACFAAWRALQAWFDTERHGNGLHGLFRRGILACSALFYLGLGIAIVPIAFGVRERTENAAARDWTGWLMAHSLGRLVVGVIAVVLAGVAVGVALKAVRAPYRDRLDAGAKSRAWTVALGTYGNFTRAFVYLLAGIFLGYAAYSANAREATGFSGVLQTIHQQRAGWLLLGVTALGLLAFGCFEIVEACMREVRAPRAQAVERRI